MKKRKRRPPRAGPLPPYIVRNGEAYISELEAERKDGIPREIVRLWCGALPEIPASEPERQFRRRVLLQFWASTAGFDNRWPAFEKHGRVYMHEQLNDDLQAIMTNRRESGSAAGQRYQAIGAWAMLATPPAGPPSPDDFPWETLADDLRMQPQPIANEG